MASLPRAFEGFASPTTNTTYVPNQFFDVCMPNYSRGTVRLVGYMIRKTLGWCDADGNPQNETVSFSYNELERKAGVSHGMIREVLDEAIHGHFIRCITAGRASSRSVSSRVATYELCWDESRQYNKNPSDFRGFFAGEGNRTYIPNQFFDYLLPNESMAVIRTVGSIIRFSIGFQNKYGHRRERATLPYLAIQRYAKIASPSVLSQAIRRAIAMNYIERVDRGCFDTNAGRHSRPAQYMIKWVNLLSASPITPKTVAAKSAGKDHSEIRRGTALKSVAVDHTENRSDIQITLNKTFKQQFEGTFEKLKAEGFDTRAAEAIASRYSSERVERQIRWIDQRKIRANRLGMLRAAIDQDWSSPGDRQNLGRPKFEVAAGVSFVDAIAETKRRFSKN